MYAQSHCATAIEYPERPDSSASVAPDVFLANRDGTERTRAVGFRFLLRCRGGRPRGRTLGRFVQSVGRSVMCTFAEK